MKIFSLIFLFFTSINTFATVDDSSLWINMNTSGKIAEKTLAYFELQPRFVNDMKDTGAIIYRTALGYQITDHLSLWAGYGYISWKHNSSYHENRPFLQSIHNFTTGRFTFINRTRFEMRDIQDRPETSLRLRHLIRSLYQFDEEHKLFVVFWDEVFYNFNTVQATFNTIPPTPREGFDQNRVFLGLGHRFGEKNQHFIESGYLNQYVVRYAKANASNHALAFQYIYNF
jgi:hypothetical protein